MYTKKFSTRSDRCGALVGIESMEKHYWKGQSFKGEMRSGGIQNRRGREEAP